MRHGRSLLWFSTAMLWCQLLCVRGVPAQSTPQAPAAAPPAPAELQQALGTRGDLVKITADRQERFGHIYHLRGAVEVLYRDMRMTADEVDYDETTRDMDARGHVRFERPANHEDIRATDAHYNLDTELGQFFNVQGTSGARPAGQTAVLTTTNPYYFEARRVDKISEKTFMVYDGFVTSCRPSNPIWTFSTPRAKVTPGESVTMRNAWVKFGKLIPFFYSPFLYHSLKRIPRSSGLLTPNIGNSSKKGRVLGESFFWAINRSMDAEFGGEYYSERGWSQRGAFNMRPAPDTHLSASYFGVVDRGAKQPNGQRVKQGGRTLIVNGSSELPHGFRAVANINYLSSFTFRLAFTESYLEAVNTEAHSSAFVSNNFRGFSLNGRIFRTQNFQAFTGRVTDDQIDIRNMPSLEFSSFERPLLRKFPLYFSFDTAGEALLRKEPRFVSAETGLTSPGVRTGFIGRFDVYPRLTAPLHWRGVHLRATWGARETGYSARFREGRFARDYLHRTAQEFSVELRPPGIERVFASPWKFLGTSVKHVVEPRAGFRLVEGVRNYNDVIVFDEKDILTDTRELDYGITNRLFSKRADGVVTEAVSWELSQRYFFDPTFGGALVPGQRNVFNSALGLTGYAFLDRYRRFSPVTSLVRFMPEWNVSAEMRSDYDPDRHRIVNSGVTVNMRRGNSFASISDFYVRSTPVLQIPSHQLRGVVGYGFPNRLGPNVGATFVYDMRQGLMPYFSVQSNYNFDCCGFNVEFRRFHFGQAFRDERQFRVAITFANIGSFGNLKKQERMF